MLVQLKLRSCWPPTSTRLQDFWLDTARSRSFRPLPIVRSTTDALSGLPVRNTQMPHFFAHGNHRAVHVDIDLHNALIRSRYYFITDS